MKKLKSQTSENRANTCEEHEESAKGGQFGFQHEGHRIQHPFNAEGLERLSELKILIAHNDLGKAEAIIDKEIAELRQRNKILKIADRHGWDTVNEYLDDPLADNNDDTIKLRGAVNCDVRKRNYRGKPYSYTGQAPTYFSPEYKMRRCNNIILLKKKLQRPKTVTKVSDN